MRPSGSRRAPAGPLVILCDVSDWKDIVAIAAGDVHTVGLKADGMVVAVGWNEYGQYDVSAWKDIHVPVK